MRMLGEPVQKLRHGVDLVVEMAVRELDHLVDKFGDQGAASGSATMPLRIALRCLCSLLTLFSCGVTGSIDNPCSPLISEMSAGPWPVASTRITLGRNRLLKAPNLIAKICIPCLLAP